MVSKAPLTPEEKKRCLSALRVLGIKSPDHPILNNRGFFNLYLANLTHQRKTNDTPQKAREFHEIIHLLTVAGTDRLKVMLKEAQQEQSTATPEYSPQSQSTSSPFTKSSQPPPPPQNISKPPPGPQTTDKHGGRVKFSTNITYMRPTASEYQHFKELPHPESAEEAIHHLRGFTNAGEYHDAHHVVAEFLANHEMNEEIVIQWANMIEIASQHHRRRAIVPTNMLWECEEVAHIVGRWLPKVSRQDLTQGKLTSMMYRCIEKIYATWIDHCGHLLNYRYQIDEKTYMRREWLDPRDFGFLVEVMRTAVQSKIPLDLLKFIYQRLKLCIAIGEEVIAHDNKKLRFRGDVLRIIASPTRDVIPDLCLEIYLDILNAYYKEGDTSNAYIFCKQALFLSPANKELLDLKKELEKKGAHQRR